jgi:hypothetical protein
MIVSFQLPPLRQIISTAPIRLVDVDSRATHPPFYTAASACTTENLEAFLTAALCRAIMLHNVDE